MALLRHYGIDPCGRHAVVIGRSPVVGRPVSMLLLRENATVTVCHTKTPDTAALTRQADIIITAAGAVNSLTAAHVRPGQTVLDVSMNWNGIGLCGDTDFPARSRIVRARRNRRYPQTRKLRHAARFRRLSLRTPRRISETFKPAIREPARQQWKNLRFGESSNSRIVGITLIQYPKLSLR